MEWYIILALIGTGLVAGFINTNAGGGSMLTLPLLMFIGLPANVANGTNRIAILLQNVVGVNTFRKKKVLNLTADYKLAIPAIIGSIIGAFIAVEIDVNILNEIIAGLMVVMLFVVVLKPEAWVKQQAGLVNAKPTVLQYIIFFFIGLYGAKIQDASATLSSNLFSLRFNTSRLASGSKNIFFNASWACPEDYLLKNSIPGVL